MKPYVADSDFKLYQGDCLTVLRELEAESVDMCCTSPPYWALRKYQDADQTAWPQVTFLPLPGLEQTIPRMSCPLGLEPTPEAFVGHIVLIFREVRRVLRNSGTLWLNIGDTFSGNRSYQVPDSKHKDVGNSSGMTASRRRDDHEIPRSDLVVSGLKAKDLVGIPWRLAFALQADGWYLRIDNVWNKTNCMPESVTDRPTKSHEYVFLLSKAPFYYYDQDSLREPAEWARWGDQTVPKYAGTETASGWMEPKSKEELTANTDRNGRSVWTFPTESTSGTGDHTAAFPRELPRRCISAGCPPRVCLTCGEPSRRIVETSGGRDWRNDRMVDAGIPGELSGEGSLKRGRSKEGLNDTKERTDLGWTDCGHDNFRPGIVLDPFMGSGTTAIVARELERHTLGIEMSDSYCRLIANRLAQQSLLATDA